MTPREQAAFDQLTAALKRDPMVMRLLELAFEAGVQAERERAVTDGVVDTGTPGWVGSPADRDLEAIKVALTWVPLDRRPREAVERVRAALVAAHAAGVVEVPCGSA